MFFLNRKNEAAQRPRPNGLHKQLLDAVRVDRNAEKIFSPSSCNHALLGLPGACCAFISIISSRSLALLDLLLLLEDGR